VFAKDVARACEFGGSRKAAVEIGDNLADSIPKRIDEKEVKTFEEAIEKAPLFGELAEKNYPELKKYAAICGKYRAWATHAAGLVISKRPLTGFVPLRKDKDGAIAIEFDKERAEENGLVKMDTLGLETLDIIDETYRLIKEAGKPLPPDPPNFEEYDKAAYDLISQGDTFCVFQLGTSSGTIDLCKKIKPKTIEDISHINSLARPSARDIREGFIAAKEGKAKVKLLHPSLKRAFGDTFGFGLYEESLMYLAQDVAGWSLHEADRLRKLTKEKGKNPKKALQWRSDFIADAKKNNNIPEDIAMKIWDEVVDKFQGYGFNMSHSIMYSMISYYTAYLKAHYPVEFLLANLMSELRSNAKIAKDNIEKIKQELRNKGIKIIPPDINESDIAYKVLPDGSLLTGLEALASVGDDAMRDLVSKRPFKSFDDLMLRADTQKVKTNTIRALAASGCLDRFGISRKIIYLYCDDYKKKLQSWFKKHNPEFDKFEYPWPVEKDWSLPEVYALEKSYLGEAFACSKRDAYGNFFKQRSTSVKEMLTMKDRERIPSIRAEVKSVFEFKVKKETSKYLGQNMIKATIEDERGDQITLTVFPDRWKDVKTRIRDLYGSKYKFDPGMAISFSGTLNVYEDEVGIILDTLYEAAPPPPLPKDLKIKKKVSMKKSSNDSEQNIDLNNIDKTVENIEDELFDEGLIDLDQEDDD
jgi:DNA polymerase-3 subunit alpha